MQVVNDDMDDLYRKAANDYPLNTDSADWNAVLNKMEDQKLPGGGESKNKNYRHLLWLLLLLPLGLFYKNYFTGDNNKAPVSKKDQANKSADKGISKTIPLTSPPKSNTVAVNPVITSVNKPNVFRTKTKGRLNIFIAENKNVTNRVENTISKTISADQNENKGNELTSVTTKVEQKKNEPVAIVENKMGTEQIKVKEENKIVPDQTPANEENKNAAKKKAVAQKERGWYAGIMISPDLSRIKFQTVKKPGVSLGIIAGYHVNKKISIESGASWDIKNYFSEGKYFSTNNIYLPSGAKIISMDGLCNMIEVPLIIKYQFITKGKNAFSASAGTSSFFMQKEKYVYDIERNGRQYPYAATYKQRSTYLFAVASVSAGYNYKIENSVSLRIEPYIKIPLKGIGTGDLPILSTGLNIGITKKLTR